MVEHEFLKLIPFFEAEKERDPENELKLTFAADKPFELNLDKDQMSFHLRTEMLEKAGDEYPPMNIRAFYKIVKNNGSYVLVKAKDFVIYPPRNEGNETVQDLSAQERVLKMILKKKLSKFFKDEQILSSSAINFGELGHRQLKLTTVEVLPGSMRVEAKYFVRGLRYENFCSFDGLRGSECVWQNFSKV